MTDTNVSQLSQQANFTDPPTVVLRNGARALLAQPVEAEVAALLSCARPTSCPQTAACCWCARLSARTRDRDRHRFGRRALPARARPGRRSFERIRFSSAILPPYARRAKC